MRLSDPAVHRFHEALQIACWETVCEAIPHYLFLRTALIRKPILKFNFLCEQDLGQFIDLI
jgi:hypothetical protein